MIALLPVTVVACDIDGDSVSSSELDAGQVSSRQYFTDGEFPDKTVTVDATVTDVLNPRSMVIDASAWGDDSVLTLFVRDVDDVREGSVVHVMGTVKRFVYADYAGQYELADEEKYEPYADEQFLVATTVATSGHSSDS